MYDYKMVMGNECEVQAEVKRLLNQGYKLAGPMHFDNRDEHAWWFIQPMILEPKTTAEQVLTQIKAITTNTPEINMSNFDDDDVSVVNNALIDIHNLITHGAL